MARSLAISLVAALLVLPSLASPAPQRANATSPGLRGKEVPAVATQHKNETLRAAAGGCTAEDAVKMKDLGAGNAEGTFPYIVAQCGKRSWSLFGGFNTANYESCIRSGTQISATCASCFSISGVYGYDNCKIHCLFNSWCGSWCLRCVDPSTPATEQCAAVPVPKATTC